MSNSALFSVARHQVLRAWRKHRKACPTCRDATARRDLYAEGARLYRATLVSP
jgi:hypothetical protein